MLESTAAARPDAARLLDAITKSRYVISDAAAPPAKIAAIDADIAAHLHRLPYPERDMAGRRTRRIGGILKRAPETRALVTNRSVLDVAEAVLGPSCDRLQLNVAEAAEIAVGETLQPPHRECSLWPAHTRNAELSITAIWPLTVGDEGPFRIWAKSHRPDAEFVDTPICPDVPPGSVLLLLGSVLCSANRNRGASPRRHLTVGTPLVG